MSRKKFESKTNKDLELMHKWSKEDHPDVRLIKLSLKLTNQFRDTTQSRNSIPEKDAQWMQSRESGKVKRKNLSDMLKTFIEYAKINGSRSADRYYANFAKMQNSALLNENSIYSPKRPIRDQVDAFTLHAFEMTDTIISLCIQKGIENKEPYKQIFQSAKKKVEEFCKSVGMIQCE